MADKKTYPRSVYHKDYSVEEGDKHKDGHEAYLKKYCRLLKSEADEKNLGPEWGDHPASRSTKAKPEEKPLKLEEKEEEAALDETEESLAPAPKKWSRK